jgi:PKHD-type hydroxylase
MPIAVVGVVLVHDAQLGDVRDATQRSILFQLDSSIQRLAKDVPGHASLVDLAGVYHNLLRAWADS